MANEDKRIIELPASESILNDDWIGKDSASQGTTKIQLSLLKQLFGGNNFAGEWHSGTAYNKDSYVTHEGKLYHNIKGGSVVAVDWSSSQWEQVSIGNELRKIVESLAPTFDTSTNYKVDDLVIYNNTLYRCIVAHTAGTWVGSHFGTVKVSSLLLSSIMDNFTDRYWENYSGSPVNYTKGTVIHKGLKLYRCKANTTNQSWDSSKWEQVDVTDLINSVTVLAETVLSNIAPTFSSLAQYNINDFVIYNNHLYVCMKPHHGSWDPLDFGTGKIGDILKGIFNNIADVYNPSNSYVKGDVVNYLGMPLKCIVDTATSPMVFSEWERVTFEQLIDEKVTDVQIAGQTTTDENKISDLTSLAIEGTASGEIASFSDGSNLPMKSFICDIDTVQDLHGYDAPWVGGAGKNKLQVTGTTETINGVTFTVNDDGTIKANGTATADAQITIGQAYLGGGNYTFSSDVNTGSSNTYYARYVARDSSGTAIPIEENFFIDVYNIETTKTLPQNTAYVNAYVGVKSGITVNNLTFKPMIRLATETDATFAPYSNICPISGHTGVDAWVRGKNLCGELEIGTFAESSQIGSTYDEMKVVNDARIRSKWLIPTFNNIVISCDFANYQFCFCLYDANKKYLGQIGGYSGWKSAPYTLVALSSYVAIALKRNDGATITSADLENCHLQVELGTTVTTYEPYNPNSQTISVSWQTEAGEVYGGYIDLVSGELTVVRVSRTINGNNINYISASSQTDVLGGKRLSTNIANAKYTNNTAIPNIDSDRLVAVSANSIFSNTRANCVSVNDLNQITLRYKGAATLEDAQNLLNAEPVQIVYELATPITYQLSPTQIKSLLGNNNAWCDTGDVNVKYNKDATIVINSLIARIEALENA